MKKNLVQDLRNWLQGKSGQYREISNLSGLNYWWLLDFKNNKIVSPSFKKIQQLESFRSRGNI